jgi:hypothetical protein
MDQSPQSEVALKETQSAARALGIQLRIFEARSPDDFESKFFGISKALPGALVVISSPMLLNNRGSAMINPIRGGLAACCASATPQRARM